MMTYTWTALQCLLMAKMVTSRVELWDAINETFVITYTDKNAAFGPGYPTNGQLGYIYNPHPTYGCLPIDKPPNNHTYYHWIALIERGGDCDFDEKVLHAQKSNYVGVIVYSNTGDKLVTMNGGKVASDILIPATYIGLRDGLDLMKYSGNMRYVIKIVSDPFDITLYLIPFAVVIGVCFILMVLFAIIKWVRDFRKVQRSRLSKQHLKKIPVEKFKKGDPYDVCAICLDDFEEGEKLRILPCNHAYHQKCVDPWLTKNKKTCPVCKRKVLPGAEDSDSDDTESDGETRPLIRPSVQGRSYTTDRGRLQGLQAEDSDSSFDEEALFPRVGSHTVDVAVVHSQSSVTGSIQSASSSSSTYNNPPPVLVARDVAGSYGSMEYRQNNDDITSAASVTVESDLESIEQPSTSGANQEMQGLIGSDTEQQKPGFFVKLFSSQGYASDDDDDRPVV